MLELDTPPLEYSLNPTIEYQPYSEYTLNVSAPGFEPLSIAGAEILPDVTAIQNITMHPMTDPELRRMYLLFPLTHYMENIHLNSRR